MNKIRKLDKTIDECERRIEKEDLPIEVKETLLERKREAMAERVYWTLRRGIDK